jgi:hypothetical protein
MSKAKRTRGKRRSSDRTVGQVEPIQTFLIVCEGKRTEPNYFRAFRVPADVQVQIVGEGYNTLSLVERAVVLAAEHSYDQVWCVFDRDSFPVESFNAALSLTRHRGFHVAYSNEAFELWYLLHFHYLQTGISRATYITRLEKELGREYHKNDTHMYAALLPRQPDAIRNAHQLLALYSRPDPARDNPSSTVHLLVEELNKFSMDALFKVLRDQGK